MQSIFKPMAILSTKFLAPLFGLFILISACSKESSLEEPVLKADFGFSETSAGTIAFTNKSENAVTYEWDFGDSTAITDEVSPSHTYFRPGSYTVTLTVFKDTKKNETKRTVIITNITPPTSVYLKGMAYTKADVTEFDNDGTAPDIYFLLYNDGGIKLKDGEVLYNLDAAYLPIIFTYKTPIKFDPWLSGFTFRFKEDNVRTSQFDILNFYFNPADYKSGANTYPTKVYFSGNGLAGYILLEWK